MRNTRMIVNSSTGQRTLHGGHMKPRPIPFPMIRDESKQNDPSAGPLPRPPGWKKNLPADQHQADLPTQQKSGGSNIPTKKRARAFL